jgi:hypothetical protein
MRHHDLVVLARQPRTVRQYRAYARIVGLCRRVLPYRLQDPQPLPVGGHYAVTRSLVAGLGQLKLDFAYQPPLDRTTARAAIVLAGSGLLGAALSWRRQGGCGFLLAGPNIVDHPHQLDRLILSSGIDGVVVASDKMRRIFETAEPSIADRLRVWPAGVDEHYWKPSGKSQRDTVLIYDKRMPDLATRLERALRDRGHRCRTLHYGDHRRDKYRLRRFRAMLDRAVACILLTYDEPQGIAATEAWSMDVPTFAYRADNVRDVDTVPYLTPETGRYWSDIDELLALLAPRSPHRFRPRPWVLENMTDVVCAQRLVALTR